MKLKQIIFAIFFIGSYISFCFAQTDREKGIVFFNKGDYKNAIKKLVKAEKKNSQDFEVLYFLGVSSIQLSNLKQAEKYLERSVKLKDDFPRSLSAMAYTLFTQGYFKDALPFIVKSVEIDSQNAESVYFLGLVHLKLDENEIALKNAEISIKLNPDIANAYLLKLNATLALSSKVIPSSNEERVKRYEGLSEIIEKFISFSPTLLDSDYWKMQMESAKFFSSYYKENVVDYLGFKIIYQPPAVFSPKGASADVSGIVRLLVEFSGNGKIGHVLVLKSLGYGLDEQAIQAAKDIRFTPATKESKNLSVAKVLEYSFRTY